MENTAKLIFEGKEYEFPIVVGTENEKAINIEKLRALTGLVTLDSGYKTRVLQECHYLPRRRTGHLALSWL